MKKRIALYYSLIVLLLLLTGVSSFFLYYFYGLRNVDTSLSVVNMEEKSSLTYNAKLKDNAFYQSSEETDTYVTGLLENLETYFNYSLSFDKPVTGEYSYYIVGNLVSMTSENELKSEIYKSETTKFEVNGNVINLSNTFAIPVAEIVKNYNQFQNNYALNLKNKISYEVHINYNVFNNKIEKYIVDESILSIEIPCEEITKIHISEPVEREKKEYSLEKMKDNELYFVVCLEFLGAIVIFLLLIVLLIKKMIKDEKEFEIGIERILRKYGNKIVRIKDLPDLSDMEVLFVDSFKDLVDASNNLMLPIHYVEVIKEKQATFIILNENIAYVYKVEKKH